MKIENSNMRRRTVASCLFLVGGLVTWLLTYMLHGLAASQAGMSAGPISSAPNRDTLIVWLLCSYFLASAITCAMFVKKSSLIRAAILAHLLVIIAFCLICFDFLDGDIGLFIKSILIFAFFITVYFLPWVILWMNIVKKGESTAPNNLQLQGKPAEKPIKIKLKY
jgi:hypothetical protein